MDEPLGLINKIKIVLKDVMEENNINSKEADIDNILNMYSYNLVKILLQYFPGATIMMDKFYRNCAILINGKVYNAYGLIGNYDYHIASEEEIIYIKNFFPKMSEDVMEKLTLKLGEYNILENNVSYTLKKNKS